MSLHVLLLAILWYCKAPSELLCGDEVGKVSALAFLPKEVVI